MKTTADVPAPYTTRNDLSPRYDLNHWSIESRIDRTDARAWTATTHDQQYRKLLSGRGGTGLTVDHCHNGRLGTVVSSVSGLHLGHRPLVSRNDCSRV